MKKILMSILLALGLVGCSSGGDYNHISQSEAKEMMDNTKDYAIVDVRTKEEYEEGHIKNAINIPNETISDNVSDVLKDKTQVILVYCRSGNRSKQASSKLAKLGYTNIYEFGGINTWEYGLIK